MTYTTLSNFGGVKSYCNPVLALTDYPTDVFPLQIIDNMLYDLVSSTDLTYSCVGYNSRNSSLPYGILYQLNSKVTGLDSTLNSYETLNFVYHIYEDNYASLLLIRDAAIAVINRARLSILPSYYVPLALFISKIRINQIEEGQWVCSIYFNLQCYRKPEQFYLPFTSSGNNLTEAIYDRYNTFAGVDVCGERLISQTADFPYICLDNIMEDFDGGIAGPDTNNDSLETDFDFCIYHDNLAELYFLYLKFTAILDYARLLLGTGIRNPQIYLFRNNDVLYQIEDGYWKYEINYKLSSNLEF